MISIIVPVHNAEKTLEAAAESVRNQTIRQKLPLELILVDDGSGDGSTALCDLLAGKKEKEPGRYPVTVKVIHMQDEGVSEARNRGLAAAEGDFVTFLDADDAMEPDMLKTLYDLHRETGAEICGCGFSCVPAGEIPEKITTSEEAGRKPNAGEVADSCDTEQEKITASEEAGRKPNTGEAVDSHDAEMERKSGERDLDEKAAGQTQIFAGKDIVTKALLCRDTRVWSKLFTRELIGEAGFLKGLSIGEDMLFVASLIRPDTRYARTEEKLYRYTINPKGAMERPFTPSYMDQIRCWEEAEKVLAEHFPGIWEEKAVRGRLASLQIVSDVLTASKIAKLPKTQRERYEAEFQLCRDKLTEHLRIPGGRAGIPADYRIKSFLLKNMPGVYRRLYE